MHDVVGINPVDSAAQFGPFVRRKYFPCSSVGSVLPRQGVYLLVDACASELLVLQLQFFLLQPVDGLLQVLCLLHLFGLLVGLFLLQAVEGFLVTVYFLLEGVLALFQFLQDAFVDQPLASFLLIQMLAQHTTAVSTMWFRCSRFRASASCTRRRVLYS